MLDSLNQGQSDISITVRRSYGQIESQSLSPQLDKFNPPKLSFEVEFSHEDSTKAFNFIKSFILLLLISRLPSEALSEAVQILEQIKEFYTESSPENLQSTTTTELVAGKIVSTETRPPLVLAWD